MAETALTVQSLGETANDIGTNLENADNTNGNEAPNPNGQLYLYMENNDGSANSATVTVTAQTTSKTVEGMGSLTKSDITVSLSDGDQKMIGPLPKTAFNDSNGDVIISYSGAGAASVDIVALEGSR